MASTTGRILESVDEGKTFQLISRPTPVAGSSERCCATLFEMPRTVGSIKEGSLLYAASDFTGGVPSMELYQSTDEGHTWSFHSVIKRAGDGKHGLWEPHFSIARDGALVVFWSDETDACCSQKLMQARTVDGHNWVDFRDTIATTVQSDRPGMVTTTKLPNGSYFMTYEVCGHFQCGVFARTSPDGWNFGDPTDLGRLLRTGDGSYFAHAPQTVWIPNDGGMLLVIGQMLYKSDGTVDAVRNGRTIFQNTSVDGSGPWSPMAAPIDVPRSFDNYCPNYSSALLPVAAGTLLELATDYDEKRQCITYSDVMSMAHLEFKIAAHVR
ncbi:hypothetical protein [Terriglobus sp.]|uniref:hypothetical protein n=1 Tax=Terriglobus sp. TaxID=1889013 RepID=UPI003AFF8DEA